MELEFTRRCGLDVMSYTLYINLLVTRLNPVNHKSTTQVHYSSLSYSQWGYHVGRDNRSTMMLALNEDPLEAAQQYTSQQPSSKHAKFTRMWRWLLDIDINSLLSCGERHGLVPGIESLNAGETWYAYMP